VLTVGLTQRGTRQGSLQLSCFAAPSNLAVSATVKRKAGALGGDSPYGPRRKRESCEDEGTLSRLIAYEEIRQLASRYALALGHCDLDALVELYVDDVEVAPGRRGRQELARHFDHFLRAYPVHFVMVGGHVINFQSESRASGTVYSLSEFGGEDVWLRQALAYEDDYEFRDGAWYFSKRRRHQLFYGGDTGLRPLAQAPANWPDSALGRGTLPQDWPSWQQYHQSTP